LRLQGIVEEGGKEVEGEGGGGERGEREYEKEEKEGELPVALAGLDEVTTSTSAAENDGATPPESGADD
jgi:hypothetical protein